MRGCPILSLRIVLVADGVGVSTDGSYWYRREIIAAPELVNIVTLEQMNAEDREEDVEVGDLEAGAPTTVASEAAADGGDRVSGCIAPLILPLLLFYFLRWRRLHMFLEQVLGMVHILSLFHVLTGSCSSDRSRKHCAGWERGRG